MSKITENKKEEESNNQDGNEMKHLTVANNRKYFNEVSLPESTNRHVTVTSFFVLSIFKMNFPFSFLSNS